MRVLGINAVFHDSAAALVVDGRIVAAAEEERFSRRKHGKRPVPFSAWELPEAAIRWCLAEGGIEAGRPGSGRLLLRPQPGRCPTVAGQDPGWEHLRTTFATRAPKFLQTLLPDYDRSGFHFVRHHIAHAASAGLVAPFGDCAVLVADGRGEATSMLAGEYRDQKLDIVAAQALPHSLGLLYEDLTAHLGFERSSDEYKVMAMASYGTPRHLPLLRQLVYATGDGGFRTERHRLGRACARPARRVLPTSTPGTPIWPPASRPCSRRCCSSSAPGCTGRPRPRTWPWPAGSR